MFRQKRHLPISIYFLLYCATSMYAQEFRKPVLVKLPFAFSDDGRTPMENTPVLFNSRLLLVTNYRPGGAEAKGKDAYLYIDDLKTGTEVVKFGQGHSFVSAFAEGDELNIFALEFSDLPRNFLETPIE